MSTAATLPAAGVAAALRAMAACRPREPAVICMRGDGRGRRAARETVTFGELDGESDALAAAFLGNGIGPGTRTVLMVPPGRELFTAAFALFKARALPVLIDPGIGMRALGRAMAQVEPEAFIGVPKAHAARVLFRWGRGSIRTLVGAECRAFLPGMTTIAALTRAASRSAVAPAAAPAHADTGEDAAAILFTSGSTGPPKGVIYTHGMFAAQLAALASTFDMRPGDVEVATFPLFALLATALGMTAVIPDMDATRPGSVNPEHVLGAAESSGATSLFGSPALLRRIGDYGAAQPRRVRTLALRRVISAGAPVPAAVLARFRRWVGVPCRVFTPYGATEALPVTCIESAEILGATAAETARGKGVCVGRPVSGIDLSVIPITEAPIARWSDARSLPQDEIGEIVVRGAVVSPAYFRGTEENRMAKIALDPTGVAHRMGDVGYLDGLGRLWFCGRKSHRVVTPARTYFTIPCEGVFNEHQAVRRTALVPVERGGAVAPVLCVEVESPSLARAERDALAGELRALGARFPHTRAIETVLFHRGFPVDARHNSKIQREKLARWAAAKARATMKAPTP